ncbi:acyl-homoserine-lactone synthase [Yersinia enterocolitica]|nr:acyl-homoserine-lactone synthase [Yersinia enterocolitica]PNM15272.1 acyl-homoserine-lactone synthase [Yersinia enterocolitica]PNM19028.1 acyl-homoserine-lactone synthase [Yersinia enterocolitica]RLY98963.1 acyl-homoserine-lactone synthase [Yersinia enterocolitica]
MVFIMLKLFNVNFNNMPERKLDEIFSLRKITFKDRLDWKVTCIDGKESDQYDDENTNYILGTIDDTIVCSVRFIDMKYPTMITGPFAPYFSDVSLPIDGFIESSRFFVEKALARDMVGNNSSLSTVLFLAMVNYARDRGHKGILTVVSRGMFILLKRSGWNITVLNQGESEKNEVIYLLHLGIDNDSQQQLINKILRVHQVEPKTLETWPMIVPGIIK